MATRKQKLAVEEYSDIYSNHKGKFLYLIKCNEFYKIGIAYNLDNRLNSLQCGNPYEIDLVFAVKCTDALEVEKLLHINFKEKWHFREWYKLEDTDVQFIKNLVE